MLKVGYLITALTLVCSIEVGRGAEIAQPLEPAVILQQHNQQILTLTQRRDLISNRLWLASLAATGAATTLDAATSWGKREGNTFLASPNGTFGSKGIAIKAGLFAAVFVPQMVFRNHEGFKKRFAIANFIEAGIFTGISVHNMGVTHPR